MNLRALDLNLLVVLEALLSERHVTRAGKRLALSQPATSNALDRLRRMFDDPLLERTPTGLELTARARALRDPLAEVLRGVSTLVTPTVIELSSIERRVRLSVADYGVSAFVGPLLQVIARRAPGVELVCLPWSGADDAHAALEAGNLDLAISVLAPSSLRFRPILHEAYVVAMREGHPAAKLTLARWLAYPHLVVSGRGSPIGALDAVLAERGQRRKVSLVVPHFLAVPSLLLQSDLIALIPERLARLSSGLIWTKPPLPVPGFDVALVWHARSDDDAAVCFVRDELGRLVATDGAPAPSGLATAKPAKHAHPALRDPAKGKPPRGAKGERRAPPRA
jgi:DNA-binding transcriptional LysR family regulator